MAARWRADWAMRNMHQKPWSTTRRARASPIITRAVLGLGDRIHQTSSRSLVRRLRGGLTVANVMVTARMVRAVAECLAVDRGSKE